MKVVPVTKADIPELIILIQSSYRGEKGWCRDTHLLKGPRVNGAMIEKDMTNPAGLFWKCLPSEEENGQDGDSKSVIMGCIFTELIPKENSLFVTSFCVHPDYQTRGIGKFLMNAAEERAKSLQCSSVSLEVIACRKELVEWYERRGYRQLEGITPFADEGIFGQFLVPKEMLALLKMQKDL